MMAFSLAVRKGSSLGSAVMWVVTPMRSMGASDGGRTRMLFCCALRRLCDLTIMNAMMATMSDSTPVKMLVSSLFNRGKDDSPRMTKIISKIRMVGCRLLPYWVSAAAIAVVDAAAMALVEEKITVSDCPTLMACGVAAVVGLRMPAGASVGGEFSLPCSDRVSVTNEVTDDRRRELEETGADVCSDDVIDGVVAVVDVDVEVVEGLDDEVIIAGSAGGAGGCAAAAGGGRPGMGGPGIPGIGGPGIIEGIIGAPGIKGPGIPRMGGPGFPGIGGPAIGSPSIGGFGGPRGPDGADGADGVGGEGGAGTDDAGPGAGPAGPPGGPPGGLEWPPGAGGPGGAEAGAGGGITWFWPGSGLSTVIAGGPGGGGGPLAAAVGIIG